MCQTLAHPRYRDATARVVQREGKDSYGPAGTNTDQEQSVGAMPGSVGRRGWPLRSVLEAAGGFGASEVLAPLPVAWPPGPLPQAFGSLLTYLDGRDGEGRQAARAGPRRSGAARRRALAPSRP